MTTLHNEVKDLNGLSYLYGGSAEFRTISQVGGELNAYYGYDIEGVYQNAAEIAADPIAVYPELQLRYQLRILLQEFRFLYGYARCSWKPDRKP